MTIEQRLVQTLRRADAFAPSPDLFARVERSIAADRAHRARVWRTVVGAVAAVGAVAGWLLLAVALPPRGAVHMGMVEAAETAVLVAALLALAPLLRRTGHTYVTAVFRLSPPTGERFLRLLDLAYYLTFAGAIVLGADVTYLDTVLRPARALQGSLERIALFVGGMGVAHALTLLVMPGVGLVFNATRRRALRRAAGATAPPVSPRAVAADRASNWLVGGVVAAGVVGVVFVVALVIGMGAD